MILHAYHFDTLDVSKTPSVVSEFNSYIRYQFSIVIVSSFTNNWIKAKGKHHHIIFKTRYFICELGLFVIISYILITIIECLENHSLSACLLYWVKIWRRANSFTVELKHQQHKHSWSQNNIIDNDIYILH